MTYFCSEFNKETKLITLYIIITMEISGKIIQVLPERGGVSQRSGTEWKLGQYVIETFEQFPKKCVFEVFGSDRMAQFNIQAGQSLTVSFDIDAHEYNGRWYNQVRAWKVVPYDPAAVAAPAAAPIPGVAPVPGVTPVTEAPFPPAQPMADATPAQAAPIAPQPVAEAPQPAPAFGGDSTDDLPF